jgi:hypothetical protein
LMTCHPQKWFKKADSVAVLNWKLLLIFYDICAVLEY